MISPQKIQELATREQTSDINIAREYLQHLFLSEFYKREGSGSFLFKGGTALRIVFNGPRYSEDLDFSIPTLPIKTIEDLLVNTFASLEREGVGMVSAIQIKDAEPTTGGYIADIRLNILGFATGIKSNLQVKHSPDDLKSEVHLIENPPFLPAYSVVALSRERVVEEKVQALVSRYKPRDFFDFYFICRRDDLKGFVPRDAATINAIKNVLANVSDKSLEDDLKPFLPRNMHPIIKDLKVRIEQLLV